MKLSLNKAALEAMTDVELTELQSDSLTEAAKRYISQILDHRHLVRQKVHELDAEARAVATRRGIELRSDALHVLVRRESSQYVFVSNCPACGVRHFHGYGSELSSKVPHCSEAWSPYREHLWGYVLVEVK